MPVAIFGIDNTGISLAVSFTIIALFAIWIALVVFTFNDARRRIADPFLIGCSTAASLFPFVGTIVYTILRPSELLDDVREREIEMKASETDLRHLEANSCHKCGFPTQPDYVRCPACRSRLKESCPSCDRPVGLRWKVCPYCEHTLIASKRSSKGARPSGRGKPAKTASAESADSEPKRRGKATTRRDSPQSQVGDADGPSKGGSSAAKKSSNDEPRRTRRVTRRDSAARKERTDESSRPEPARDPETSERRRVIVDEDTEVSHRPINSGDSPASVSNPDDG